MSTDKTREAFEAWMTEPSEMDADNDYASPITHDFWTVWKAAWQASRNAALAEAAGVCRVRADDTSYHRMVRAASGTCANLIEELRNE